MDNATVTNDGHDLSKKQRDLVARIYAGALDPSSYQDLLRAWDDHYQTLGDVDQSYHETDFDWAEEWIGHFEAAGAVFDKLEQVTHPPLETQIAASSDVVFAIDQFGRVSIMSTAARAELGFVTHTSTAELNFDAASHGAIEALRQTLSSAEAVDPAKRTLLRLFPAGSRDPLFFLAEIVVDSESRQSLILVRSANAAWHKGIEHEIQSAFGLTTAETDLVRNLYLGRAIKDIAVETGRSPATLRTQLSSVLGKIGVKSQVGLARAVSGLMHVLSQDAAGNGLLRLNPPQMLSQRQRETVLSVSEDVDVHIVESGDLAGRPVFFIQTTTWPTLTPDIVNHLAAHRIRLISPYRAGVARTTRTPVSFSPRNWAQSYQAVLDHLDLKDLWIGGMCSGGLHAMELAQTLGDRCKGVLLVDMGAPLKSVGMVNQMPLAARRLFLGARLFPLALRTPYKLATADFYSGEEGRARGVDYFVDGSPHDAAAVKADPALWRIVRDNFDYCMRNPLQSANDVVHWSRDTTDSLRKTLAICPVRYLHGEQNLVQRAEHVVQLAQAHPNVTARIVEDESQFLIYRRPDVFADELAKLVGH